MSAAAHGDREGRWGWRLTGLVTLCVYIFLFAPIIATVVLSFNASMFGGFPMTGFSLQWYGKLLGNEQVLAAFRTSMWIAVVVAAITTVVGVVTAFALVRFEFPGKQLFGTLVILPALVPETILGVGLLVAIKAIDQPRTLLLLVLGHILLAVPYVVLIAQARMVGIRRVYEEAALSLGASRLASFREITLPLLIPAVVAFERRFPLSWGALRRHVPAHLAATAAFCVLHVLCMILVTVGIPLVGGIMLQGFTRLRRRNKSEEKA